MSLVARHDLFAWKAGSLSYSYIHPYSHRTGSSRKRRQEHCLSTVWFDFPRRGGAFRETTSKDRFRRALLLMKPAHTGHHPGAVPGFRPSPGNSEETTTRVLTEEISVLFRVPTWDPTHPGSPVSRALPGNTPTQGPTREGKPGFFLGGGGNPGRNPGHGLGKTRERGGFRVFPGWYCWGLPHSWIAETSLHFGPA